MFLSLYNSESLCIVVSVFMYPSGVIVREFGFKSFVTQKSLVEDLEVWSGWVRTSKSLGEWSVAGVWWDYVSPYTEVFHTAVSSETGATGAISIAGYG